MRLVQYRMNDEAYVGTVSGGEVIRLNGYSSVYNLARESITKSKTMDELVQENLSGERNSYEELLLSRSILSPVSHPDPGRFWITGTGLTHSGSADARDDMHKKLSDQKKELSDSMKMFQMGLEGGKPPKGSRGVQPEWFYKGNGSVVVEPGHPIDLPDFALDGGEEPEIVAIYLIGDDGNPYRLGFALGNEFSDHVMEKQNYLYLAHSKLRQCSFGPELQVIELPSSVKGKSSIERDTQVVWEKEFASGEEHMIHSISNLEYHHFKYPLFRRPGDLHAHFLGTATLSFADGFKVKNGDIIRIEAEGFGAPLTNEVSKSSSTQFDIKKL